jgi:hypothetical protein
MIKTILKHHVYDLFLNTLFDGFIETFNGHDVESNKPTVGKYYSRIEHIDGYESFYNCVVKAVDIVGDSKYFIKIGFEYVKDYTDVDEDGEQMTVEEFADAYGDLSDDDDNDEVESNNDMPSMEEIERDGIDLILNEDRTVSLDSDFYLFFD